MSIRYIEVWHVQNDEHVLHFVINGHLISTQPSPQQEQEIRKSGLAAIYMYVQNKEKYHIHHSHDEIIDFIWCGLISTEPQS